MSAAWPDVVDYVLGLLPTLEGWQNVSVYDTDVFTTDIPELYAVVGRTSTDNTSGSYARQMNLDGGTVDETGSVRIHVVAQTGDLDPTSVRASARALIDPFETAIFADQTLGGILGAVGTASVTVDLQSISGQQGVAQSLVVSLNYTARH